LKRRVFPASPSERLDDAVARELGVTAAEASRWVESGAVYVGGKRLRAPSRRLAEGEVVTVVLEESGKGPTDPVPPLPLAVLHEDRNVLAVNKPAGVTTQPSQGRSGDSLLDAATAYLGRPAGLVHRLDRETSGVVLFAKTREATTALAAAFREGRVEKHYLAVTGPGLPERGTVDLPLSKDPRRPGRFRATRQANGVSASTDYLRRSSGAYSVVELLPRTGRTHQLRAHLSALGFPIAGDARYGGPPELGGISAPRCMLHAWKLSLELAGRPLALRAPPPDDLRAFLSAGDWGIE